MSKLDAILKNIVSIIDGAVACGVVDLDNGMLLGIHNASGYARHLNELVSGATMDLFRGPTISRVEESVRAHRGQAEDGAHYFEEMHIVSAHNFHFAKTVKEGRYVIMLVTQKTTNIGMGWAQLRTSLPTVEPLLP